MKNKIKLKTRRILSIGSMPNWIYYLSCSSCFLFLHYTGYITILR